MAIVIDYLLKKIEESEKLTNYEKAVVIESI